MIREKTGVAEKKSKLEVWMINREESISNYTILPFLLDNVQSISLRYARLQVNRQHSVSSISYRL